MDPRLVESAKFLCSRFGGETRIDIYSFLKPITDGTVLPARVVRAMQCQNENNCGIATQSPDGNPNCAWHLCPASEIFLERGTLIEERGTARSTERSAIRDSTLT